MKRVMIAVLAAAGCCVGLWQAARIGRAHALAQEALRTNNPASADRAVSLVANDAETHAARGAVLQRTGDYAGACRELERAIQLRPRDYFLWMLLGVSRDLNNDQEGAVKALRQATLLSPVYAKSHWLLGNLLLRTNNTPEAIQELRFAANSDETLLPNVIDLFWGINHHDAAATINALQPQTDNARMALAVFFAGQRQGPPALEQFRSIKSPTNEGFHNLMNALLQARLFAEAWEVWARLHQVSDSPALLNPGFEDEIAVGEIGFGWQISDNVPNVTMSADPTQYQSGQKSLRVDFRGESNTTNPIVTQLVLVKPHTTYRLTFQALAKDFLSATAPIVAVTDASDEKNPTLAQSLGVAGAAGWQVFFIDFTTRDQTTAVRLQFTRPGCGNNPCAAFGTVWLDSFDLRESSATKGPAK
jgi:tetratricopeptide (TPR) repeat protein